MPEIGRISAEPVNKPRPGDCPSLDALGRQYCYDDSHDASAMTQVCLHYWAGARAAAGVEQDVYQASTIADALALATDSRDDRRFATILSGCTLLVDGRAVHPDERGRPLAGDVTVEILPPFAGG